MSDSPVRNVTWEGKTAIIEASGDIDFHRSSPFQKDILEVVGDKPDQIVVNLSDVPYMDSSGVASLVKLLSRTRAAGIGLKLLNPTIKVRSIFEITSLDTVFEIEESG
jgi:anti-sigma B factor antagonist